MEDTQHDIGGRPLSAILDDLHKPPAKRHLETKKKGGAEISFMPWHRICDYLDYYAPGWEWEIETDIGHDRLFVVGRLTIYGSDRHMTMAATGTERLDTDSFGDPSSNAEAMALRRAAAKFGFCRHLWDKR